MKTAPSFIVLQPVGAKESPSDLVNLISIKKPGKADGMPRPFPLALSPVSSRTISAAAGPMLFFQSKPPF
jgi:hypothetical protein